MILTHLIKLNFFGNEKKDVIIRYYEESEKPCVICNNLDSSLAVSPDFFWIDPKNPIIQSKSIKLIFIDWIGLNNQFILLLNFFWSNFYF